jgi:hypothetical protein
MFLLLVEALSSLRRVLLDPPGEMRKHAAQLGPFRPEAAQRDEAGGVGRAEVLELQADRAGIASDHLLQLADLVAGEASVEVDVADVVVRGDGDAKRHENGLVARVVPAV